MHDALPIAQLPGYRRSLRVAAGSGWVRSALEDDYHCMRVTIRHDGRTATSVVGEMLRAPWSTCPEAPVQLRASFEGVALADFTARGEKAANCTHLHDLALLAAAHAFDAQPLAYDIFVADPVDGLRRAEIHRDGVLLLSWSDRAMQIVAPGELAGTHLMQMREWIATLAAPLREAARLLQWANIIANGRQIPLERQSDATRMPPNCYSFQPERKAHARRVGHIHDFSREAAQPLDGVSVGT